MSIVKIDDLKEYNDENGNSIFSSTTYDGCVVIFRGGNNKVIIDEGAKISNLVIHLDCNYGTVHIGNHNKVTIPLKGTIRVGQNSSVIIGDNVTSSPLYISAVEGASVTIGDDCMFATSVILRTDDSHPIFDVRTEKRVNPARDIKLGSHVWVGERAVIFGGSVVGDGSIVGMGSILKRKCPNNCIVAGIPARVTRKNIAWERPHLSLSEPFMKPDSSSVAKSEYWNYTDEI